MIPETIREVASLLTLVAVVALVFPLALSFLRNQTRHQKQSLELQRKQLEFENQRQQESKTAARDPGGYIYLDLPDGDHSVFVDLLKGFEEYSFLRGYRVRFSFDPLLPNKVAFKFTVGEQGLSVSTEQVKRDFEDYLERVRTGASLDDLPVVISKEQHDLLLTTLKNRINFLTHSYRLVETTMQHYENLLREDNVANGMFRSASTIVVQDGGVVNSSAHTALNSPLAVQGNQNRDLYIEADNGVHIGRSFNQRHEQIASLDRLITLLKALGDEHADERDIAVRSFENIHDEVSEKEAPDKSRIAEWFSKATEALQVLSVAKVVTKEAAYLIKKAYECFDLQDLTSGWLS